MKSLLRPFLRSPGFCAVVVATLALGIGVNTAIFSVVESVLLRAQPYADAERLVFIWQVEGDEEHSNNWFTYQDWKTQNASFSDIAIYRRDSFNLSGTGAPEHLIGALASANLFSTLGIPLALGRGFTPEEDSVGGPRVVLLSQALWQRRFGSDPHALGQSVVLNGIPHTIVGVMPAALGIPSRSELWVPVGPYSADARWVDRGNNPGLFSVARLRPEVTLGQAQAEMAVISDRIAAAYPAIGRTRAKLTPLIELSIGEFRRSLWTLAGAAALILAIACANVAGLQLARGVSRSREIALRAALGAGRNRLIRELLGESLILAAIGGGLGIGLAYLSLDVIQWLAPAGAIRFQQLAVNAPVLGFAVLTSLVVGLVSGLWPAWRATRFDLRGALQAGGASAGLAPSAGRARQWLVVGQVALTLTLLSGAGLLLASLDRMQREKLGFDSRDVLTFRLDLPVKEYDEQIPRVNQLLDNLRRDLGALPGVRSVAANYAPPLRPGWQSGFHREDRPAPKAGERPSMELSFLDGPYFATMGIPLLRGRSFDDTESPDGPRGIIVDQAFADRHFPGEDALGKRIVLGDGWSKDPELQKATIIGIVPTLKLYGYAQEPRLVQAYLARRQIGLLETTFVLKGIGDLRALAPAIRAALAKYDPTVPIFDVRTMDEVVDGTFAAARLYSTLLTLFATLALVLAALGLWGVVGYAVAQRRREIGLRLALGAGTGRVVGLMIWQGLRPLAVGVAAGLGAAFLAGRLLQHLLFRVAPFELAVVVPLTLGFIGLAALACWFPARGAARVAPAEALRAE